jgi:hypothetical protein
MPLRVRADKTISRRELAQGVETIRLAGGRVMLVQSSAKYSRPHIGPGRLETTGFVLQIAPLGVIRHLFLSGLAIYVQQH